MRKISVLETAFQSGGRGRIIPTSFLTNPPFPSGLLQQFNILPEVKGVRPKEEGTDGITQLPVPFKVILQSRHTD